MVHLGLPTVGVFCPHTDTHQGFIGVWPTQVEYNCEFEENECTAIKLFHKYYLKSMACTCIWAPYFLEPPFFSTNTDTSLLMYVSASFAHLDTECFACSCPIGK
ncbi:hypothetical protein AMECASPLE_036467 [Ameca splendens]|uniref:Uncharacterized protein n=1 Tax=Ameca splendens TaxID=208324 RepID=A0ABV0Z6A3_9TELE